MWTIYKHTNKINGKTYIGKTTDIRNRWRNNGIHYKTCPRFWSAIKHYGWDNFSHEILESNIPDNEVDEKEKEYIQKYRTLENDFGYNLNNGGCGGNAWAGKTQEEKNIYKKQRREETLSRGAEWHKKLSDSQKKSWENNKARKEKLSNRMKGGNNPIARKCLCIETGIIYNSYADAAEACGYSRKNGSKIGMVIRGERNIACGYHWKEAE